MEPGDRDAYFEERLDAAFRGHIWRGSGLDASSFLRRMTNTPRVIVKEVASFVSLPWVVDRWDPAVLIIMRHPAACVASVRGLKRDASEIARLALLRGEPRLRARHLSDVAAHLDAISDPLEAAVASWAIRMRVILREACTNPEWTFVRYEDLAARPVEEFRRLFATFALDWRPETEAWVHKHTQSHEPGTFGTTRKSSDQIWRWQEKLSRDEVDRIRRVLDPFELEVYASDAEWAERAS